MGGHVVKPTDGGYVGGDTMKINYHILSMRLFAVVMLAVLLITLYQSITR